MLLIKMIKIALLLKDLELMQFFTNKENIDIKALVKHLESIDESIVIEIARIATDDKSINNEIDAVLALSSFFLKLIQQAKSSKYLMEILPHLSLLSSVVNPIVQVK